MCAQKHFLDLFRKHSLITCASKKRAIQESSMSGTKGKGPIRKTERRTDEKGLKLDLLSYKHLNGISWVRKLLGQPYHIQEKVSWGIGFIFKSKIKSKKAKKR